MACARSYKNSLDTAVTSAPMSSLNTVGWVLTLTVALQAVDELEIKQTRYNSSENPSVITISTILETHWGNLGDP